MATNTLTLKIDARDAIDELNARLALAELIAFIDGLTYQQLEHVDGLFAAAQKARAALGTHRLRDDRRWLRLAR